MRNRLNKASGRNDAWFAAASIAAIAGLGLCSEAKAQDVSANVALTSDYVFRGVSQTQEDPAISAGVDLTRNGFYAGGWASNVDFGEKSTAPSARPTNGPSRAPSGVSGSRRTRTTPPGTWARPIS